VTALPALRDWLGYHLVMVYPISWTHTRVGYRVWLWILPLAGNHVGRRAGL
jgi:hypothetical protein